MIPAPQLPDEALRLAALQGLAILDTPPEERFDRLTRLARRLFDVPVALVSLVDADRQWFKSCVGVGITESPRDVSFCGHAIADRSPLVVEDALLDERFADNPFVTGEMGVRFYAGC
ncbi:MAG: GAF domain-containing protein, partial [Acidimicrobiia bacterium]